MVNVADHGRLRQGEEIAIVQQVFCRVLEALTANIALLHSVGAQGGAHGAVDDGNAQRENL